MQSGTGNSAAHNVYQLRGISQKQLSRFQFCIKLRAFLAYPLVSLLKLTVAW